MGPVIRNNRRIAPVPGHPRPGTPAPPPPGATWGAARPAPAGPQARHGRADEEAGITDEGIGNDEVSGPAFTPNKGTKDTGPSESSAVKELQSQLAERTADLQRLQAEYANYRKRVDRDRATVREQAVASALSELLPVLDAIGQAREHGELSGGFKSVADSLQASVAKLGLVSYGQRGDAFDPKIHEALTHTYSPDVVEDTCIEIFQPGYKVGERTLRPARVAVAAPTTGPDGSDSAEWPTGEENN